MTKELECTTEIVPQIRGTRIHILIGVSNWTNKGEIMYVSRLKRWYSMNNRSNRQLIHKAEVGAISVVLYMQPR